MQTASPRGVILRRSHSTGTRAGGPEVVPGACRKNSGRRQILSAPLRIRFCDPWPSAFVKFFWVRTLNGFVLAGQTDKTGAGIVP